MVQQWTMNKCSRAAIVLALPACFYLLAASAEVNASNRELSALENKLFFTAYPKESVTTRLTRLEKQIFGDELAGSADERLKRLVDSQKDCLNLQEKPDMPRQSPANTIQPRQAPSPAIRPVVVTASSAASNSTEPDERQCLINRQRTAVKAARDEEIDKLLSQGVELWRNHRGVEATDRFEEVVRLEPNNAQAHFSLGIIQESQGNYVEAAASYGKAAQINPDSKEYKEALAGADRKAKKEEVVIGKRAELARLAEDATAAFKRGEYLSALDLYKRLDEKAPRQALVKYNIGTIYLVMKQPERALEFYKEARKLKPGEPRYTKAYEELLAVVQKDRKEIQQDYDHYKQQEHCNTLNPMPIPASESAMAGFGILGKSAAGGVKVTTIGLSSQALRAGLQSGDIIKAVDGTIVKNTEELNDILARKAPGQQVQLTIQRSRRLSQLCLN